MMHWKIARQNADGPEANLRQAQAVSGESTSFRAASLPAKPLAVFAQSMLQAFTVAMLLAICHRLMAFSYMANGVTWDSEVGLKALAVGLLSDAWISVLLAFTVGLLAEFCRLIRLYKTASYFAPGFGSLMAVMTAGHQSYVGFFRFPIIPYHLTYLVDWRFLRANGSSLVEPRALGLLIFGFALAWGIYALNKSVAPSRAAAISFCVTILVLGLGAHAANIRYRVNWFIPDNLIVSPVERLYMRLFVDLVPPPLTTSDQLWLDQILHGNKAAAALTAADTEADDKEALFRLLASHGGSNEQVQDIAVKIKAEFAKSVLAKRKPVAMILLLESLRPSETGYFAPQAGPTLTPNLDALAAGGIVFKRAFSTGTVTRGAQESTLCGYLGSRTTSLMRGSNAAYFACLPDLATSMPNPIKALGDTFWYHGGEALYDNQEPYWRQHSVHDFLDRDAFPGATPQTSWGISDKPFFAAAGQHLLALHKRSSGDYLLGLALSVTNHIPWDIPTDAGPEVKVPRAAGHDSYRTTAYTDAALGSFIAQMRESGLWQDLLLVIASDHGNQVPPLVDLYPSVSVGNKMLPLLSHINLVVTGGLTEAALKDSPNAERVHPETVSQVGIAAFMAYVIGLPAGQFMAENLFIKKPELPVLSNLDEVVVDQGTGHAFTPEELTDPSPPPMSNEQRKGLLYYRAFLHYINTMTNP